LSPEASVGARTPLRLIIIEDRPDDAALMLRELRRAGLEVDATIVCDEAGLLEHLSPPPDLILADYSLPTFSALRALEVVRERAADLPLVVVSGSISEEIAVDCMLRGATDYVLKDRPARLGQAAIRAIGEAQLRQEKRLAEEAQRQSEERYRRFAENAQDVIFRYRVYPDAAFEYVSPSATAVTGYTPEEHYADPQLGHRLMHPEDNAGRLTTDPSPGGSPVVFRWVHKKGHTIWVEQTRVPIYDAGGRIVAVEGITRDVSERHRSDEALRLSESRFRGIFEASPIGVAVVCSGGGVIEMNPACKEVLGIDPEPGSECGLVLSADVLSTDLAARLSSTSHGRFELQLDLPAFAAKAGYVARRGGTVHLDVLLTPLASTGEPFYLAQLQDVTERRRLEAQLQQSQKMETIGMLAGGIAHDFNNLLTAITGYATFAKLSLADEDPSGADLEEVLKATERASNLTGQLLAFARNQSAQMQRLDVNELIADMDRLFRRLIREDIDLVTQPAEGLWPVEADRGQLEQVLVNLVVNARDAMPAGGRLTIATRNVRLQQPSDARRLNAPPGEYVVLSVRDSGGGISPEATQHLFEPFFTTKTTGQGTGLGLAVVYSVVQQHRGDISVESERGQGATFEVYLPRGQADAASTAVGVGGRAQRGTETILLAEDEASVRRVAERMLRSLGYNVLPAADGEEAMRVAADWAGHIDALLTDVVMPRMSGRELARRMRLRHPDLRVLYASGYTDTPFSDADRTERTDFLQKPYTAQTLGQGLRRLLDR
jgi:two-component system, cell cycle sensor histidine kinase and response regulator CckA